MIKINIILQYHFQENGKAQCLCDSTDGRYLFIGLPNGLSVINASNQTPVTSWEDDGVDVKTIKACLVGVHMYLVITIDAKCK